MEATKRKHYDETEIDDPETASLWFFNPSSLKNQSIDINKNKFLIGRGTDVDLQVTSPRISRAHCLIQTVGTLGAPKWELVDKNSTMGTYLNGRRVQAEKPTPLKDGDVIYLSDPDVYPIRFVTSGGSAPAKVSKPGPASTDDNDVIVIHDLSQDFKRKTETNDKIVKAVIDLTSSDHSDLQVLNKPSIGLFEGTSAKSCDNIISNTSTKPKLVSNSIADKENNVNEDSKPKASELSKLNQKLQDQQQEIERLRAELKNKDEEMSRLSKDKEILKFIEETNKEIMKNLNDDLYAMKEELERCQESNSEVAVMLKTTKTFIDLIEAELQCSICNEVIVTASIVMPCFHVFCNACISLWFRQKQECAVCRTPAQVSVPCKMLDSFVDKLMEITPDADYRQKRRQICQERRAQEPPPVAHPPPPPRVGAPPAAHQARHVLHNPYGQMLMEVIIGGGGGAQMMANEEGLMIDLTVQDMAAHNVAAAAARAYNANPVARPRTRRGRGHRAN